MSVCVFCVHEYVLMHVNLFARMCVFFCSRVYEYGRLHFVIICVRTFMCLCANMEAFVLV